MTDKKEYTPKDILDRWATEILRKNAIWEKNGRSIPNKDKTEDYTPEKYSEDIVLWIPPKDCIRLEFEHETYETNLRCIRECESACKTLGLDYCITEHKGGKSPYINIFNIKKIPVNEDNPLAKNLFVDLILPNVVKEGLDRSNLGWTSSPVIEHAHWKKKYKGAIHKIIRGKHPLEHNNEYPKELLRQIKKSKTGYKHDSVQVKQKYAWVDDFLLKYCIENKLPVGNRNHIIEKNLAVRIIHHKERDKIISKYLKRQERKHDSLKGWFNKVIKGEITQVSPLELKKYIEDNSIAYTIPETSKKTSVVPDTKPITTDEHVLLTKENLLDIIVKEIQNKKVVGETKTIKCIFIVTNCRLVKNIKPTSSNLNVNDESGIGKDWIVKAVMDILPDNVIVYRTKITPELLTYWHNSKYEPDWTWNGKILYIEDISSNLLNSDVFKVFSSGGSKATVLIKQYPVDIIINGKPSMIVTSYHVNPNNENLRRYPICFCDSSEEQTKEIMKRQSIEDATGLTNGYDPKIKDALSKLKRVSVIIPFAEKIPDYFPTNKYMRTHYKRFLDYIKSSACLHQYQRDKDENNNIIATGHDYDIAREVLLKSTDNPSMIPLTREQDNILNFFKENNENWYSVNDIENKFPISTEWFRKQLKQLNKHNFLNSRQEKIEGVKRKVTQYQYNAENDIEIPLYSKIIKDSSINTTNTNNQINTIDTINNDLTEEKSKRVYRLNELNELNEHGVNVLDKKNSLNDRILELKEYCEKVKKNGHKITYENLCFNFDKPFIENCKRDKILIGLPDGSYDIGGS